MAAPHNPSTPDESQLPSYTGLERRSGVERRREPEALAYLGYSEPGNRAVRQLSGLLPLCAWCKNIRNDEGYWEEVEDYLTAGFFLLASAHAATPRALLATVERVGGGDRIAAIASNGVKLRSRLVGTARPGSPTTRSRGWMAE